LAIANDKLLSTKVLLENGASFNILDSDKKAAIHEATEDINSRKNSYKILEILIKYGADVNMLRINPNRNDTLGYSVPLMGAINNLQCLQLLLDNGANP
jgi:ankyrin repeat protein